MVFFGDSVNLYFKNAITYYVGTNFSIIVDVLNKGIKLKMLYFQFSFLFQ